VEFLISSLAMTQRLQLGSALVAVAFALAAAAQGGELAVGDLAPGFELKGSDGRVHRLSDHIGRRGVVLAWFPKAFTPG